MVDRQHEDPGNDPPPGTVSEGGVDSTTAAITAAVAGAALGASAGPLGVTAGAVIGAAVGALAARGPENPSHPEPWQDREERWYDPPDEPHE
jgi:hypothetical protein